MYTITIYDYEGDYEWVFKSDIASINEAKELKDALAVTFKMLDVQDRASVRIRIGEWYVH